MQPHIRGMNLRRQVFFWLGALVAFVALGALGTRKRRTRSESVSRETHKHTSKTHSKKTVQKHSKYTCKLLAPIYYYHHEKIYVFFFF